MQRPRIVGFPRSSDVQSSGRCAQGRSGSSELDEGSHGARSSNHHLQEAIVVLKNEPMSMSRNPWPAVGACDARGLHPAPPNSSLTRRPTLVPAGAHPTGSHDP